MSAGLTGTGPTDAGPIGRKIVAVLLLAVLVYAGLSWWQSRQQAGPGRSSMASASVVRDAPGEAGRTRVTARYVVDGKPREVTQDVGAAAYAAQGKVVWVCFDPADPGDASLRLPADPLCGQR